MRTTSSNGLSPIRSRRYARPKREISILTDRLIGGTISIERVTCAIMQVPSSTEEALQSRVLVVKNVAREDLGLLGSVLLRQFKMTNLSGINIKDKFISTRSEVTEDRKYDQLDAFELSQFPNTSIMLFNTLEQQ